ncbi:MAG: hypothetical protein ACNA78_02225 [Balneolaceae bacterium]
MTMKQTVWLITWIITLVCLLMAFLIYQYTGTLFLVIFIAPPLIHYILSKRMDRNR